MIFITNLSQDLANVTLVVDSLSSMTVDIMEIFMEPPLVMFVGLGFFGSIAALVRKFLKTRK